MKIGYLGIGMIFVAFPVLVILTNNIERNNYINCAAESIPSDQTSTLNYGGNVRNDKVSPRTCSDNNGISTFEERNIFLPSVFQ